MRTSTLTPADSDQRKLLLKEAVKLLHSLGECFSASSRRLAQIVGARSQQRLAAGPPDREAGLQLLDLLAENSPSLARDRWRASLPQDQRTMRSV